MYGSLHSVGLAEPISRDNRRKFGPEDEIHTGPQIWPPRVVRIDISTVLLCHLRFLL
jgi:hypothetical protein